MQNWLSLHSDVMALALWIAIAALGVLFAAVILPRVYRHRSSIFGAASAYDLSRITNQDMRDAGIGWAIAVRRVAILLVILFLLPVFVLPTYCQPV